MKNVSQGNGFFVPTLLFLLPCGSHVPGLFPRRDRQSESFSVAWTSVREVLSD